MLGSSRSLAKNGFAVLTTPWSQQVVLDVAVPAKIKSVSATLNPFTTSPVKLGIVSMFWDVNATLLQSPTNVPPTQYFTIVLLVPVLSNTVTTSGSGTSLGQL